MAYVYHANGVVTGTVNSFCLACDTFLMSNKEAKQHITETLHKQKLNGVPHVEKFKDEGIRKFTTGYFCEFCNALLPIAAKVTLHISEDEHKHNKNTLRLKLMGCDVIVFDEIIVHEKAWHGLNEGICSVCNTEFDNENDHKKDSRHALNLVLKPIKFAVDNAIYREIDASAVHCLTCNKLLAPRDMRHHADLDEHATKYEKSRIKTNGVNKKLEENVGGTEKEILNPKIDGTEKDITPAEDKTKILDFINIYNSKGITINLETEVAYCRKCSITVPFTVNDIENHFTKHTTAENNDSEQKYPSHIHQSLNRVNINKTSESNNDLDHPSKRDENMSNGTVESPDPASTAIDNDDDSIEQESCQDFAEENSITYNEGKAAAFCRICKVQLPSSLSSMKQHVSGASHKKKAQPVKLEKKLPTVPTLSKKLTREFMESEFSVKTPFYADVVINEEHCIPQLSFLLVTRTHNFKWRCLLCEKTFHSLIDINLHVKSGNHSEKFLALPVITSKSDEFIREIRKGLFHCGYCDVLVSSWDEMELHLKCYDHKNKKELGKERLNSHLPDIRGHQFMERLEFMRFLHMLSS